MLRNRPSVMYPVNEVFATVQGEGQWTGTPAVFVRLQGCPVGCGFCDTKHTWEVDPSQEATATEVLAKVGTPSLLWSSMGVETLRDAVVELAQRSASPIRHAVITGGEPAMYDLRPLCVALEAEGFVVQIETSGTFELQVTPATWVTVSPKIGMPGGRSVHLSAVRRADEVKHVASNDRHVNELTELLAAAGNPRVPIWLQPLAPHKNAPSFCARTVVDRGWKLSVQTHKAAGLR